MWFGRENKNLGFALRIPGVDWREVSLLTFILCLTFLIRVPFLDEPLECDQANFCYIAWGWEHGKIPYRDLWDNKPPVLYLFFRLILRLFGKSVESIHLAYALLAVVATFFFYRLSRLFFRKRISLLAAFLYGLFSGGALVSGSFANSENLMVFFVILAFYFFWKAYRENQVFSFFISGTLIGFAMMSKQVAIWELAGVSFFLYYEGRRQGKAALNLRRIALVCLGAALVLILFSAYFIAKGAGQDFFDSVFLFNLFFARIVGIRQGLINLWDALFWTPRENLILWLLAGMGAYSAILKRDDKSIFFLCWLGADALGVLSSWRFYPHYFIETIPALVIMSSFYLNGIFNQRFYIWKKYLASGMLILTVAIFLGVQWNYYFKYGPAESLANRRGSLARFQLYQATPYMADFIRQNTGPDDYIYIWGLWPAIYLHSERHASSKYFFLSGRSIMVGKFPSLVHPRVLADTLKNKPKYFIIDSPFACLISAPLREYLKNNYFLEREVAGCQVLRRRAP